MFQKTGRTWYKCKSVASPLMRDGRVSRGWEDKRGVSIETVNLGRKISRYVCDILRDDDKLIAQVTSTVMTLRGDQALGR